MKCNRIRERECVNEREEQREVESATKHFFLVDSFLWHAITYMHLFPWHFYYSCHYVATTSSNFQPIKLNAYYAICLAFTLALDGELASDCSRRRSALVCWVVVVCVWSGICECVISVVSPDRNGTIKYIYMSLGRVSCKMPRSQCNYPSAQKRNCSYNFL